MEQNNLLQTETKVSKKEEINFDELPLEAKVGTLAQEMDIELQNFERLLPRLSKKQLERVLRRVVSYPMTMVKPSNDEAERVVGGIGVKIEHLKILTIKYADELDKLQKEQNDGKETVQA